MAKEEIKYTAAEWQKFTEMATAIKKSKKSARKAAKGSLLNLNGGLALKAWLDGNFKPSIAVANGEVTFSHEGYEYKGESTMTRPLSQILAARAFFEKNPSETFTGDKVQGVQTIGRHLVMSVSE
jgi:hypothetical protein